MIENLLIASCGLLVLVVLVLLVLVRSISKAQSLTANRLDSFEKAQERTQQFMREELAQSRGEFAQSIRGQRLELTEAFKSFADSVTRQMMETSAMQKGQLENFSSQLSVNTNFSAAQLESARTESSLGARQLREEVLAALKGISELTTRNLSQLAHLQKSQLQSMVVSIEKLSESNEKKLEAVRLTVEGKLQSLQADNARQLEQMRQTVDEKLQGTLEKRLGESFRQVSERLERVHKGLGEMQSLATGVGDLKKVLTNVKTRGTWGEVQLGALLEQVLHADQFDTNVATREGAERVEFAIKLPGQGTALDETVWLPIDAKFPIEDYQRLLEAQDLGQIEVVESAGRQLEIRVKASAADISKKYLNPPQTTDFAILFLPIEGLFAEVIRRTGLVETLQREYRVVIAGPTTLWSILNSLQMGFRTLAIQQRSSEVWNLLAAVKTEWTKYGEMLEVVQKKLHQASDTIERAKVRSRAVGRKLKDVQELPAGEASALLADESVYGSSSLNDDADGGLFLGR